eukprot:scaffold13755_cov45-Phaeocystis_antarctica.AAC.1
MTLYDIHAHLQRCAVLLLAVHASVDDREAALAQRLVHLVRVRVWVRARAIVGTGLHLLELDAVRAVGRIRLHRHRRAPDRCPLVIRGTYAHPVAACGRQLTHVEVSRGAAVDSRVGLGLRLPRLAALAALGTDALVVILL